MCAVSYVGDYWGGTVPNRHPWIQPNWPIPISPYPVGTINAAPVWSPPVPPPIPSAPKFMWEPKPVEGYTPTREELDELKRDLEEVKKLLIAAKRYDEAMGEPDCELEEKIDKILKLAKYVGVDMSDVFPEKK